MPQRFDLQSVFRLILSDPRGAFRLVSDLGLSRETLWQMLALLVALRVVIMGLLGGSFTVPFGMTEQAVSPFAFAFLMAANSVVTVFLVHYAGRALDGKGTFEGAMIVVLLTDALSVASSVVMLVLGLLVAGLAGVAGLIVAIGLFLYTLVFIDENHAFGSLLKAFGTLILGVLGLVVVLTLLSTLFGAGAILGGV